MFKSVYSAFLLFVCINLSYASSHTHPPYRQYNLRDGLIQMQITKLFQDSRGYLWVGTKGGVSCFDGEKFTNYTEKNGLGGSMVLGILEDDQGHIWINTSNGLSRFNGKEIEFFPIDHGNISQFTSSSDGRIWIITEENNAINFGYLIHGKYHYLATQIPRRSDFPTYEFAYHEESNSLFINRVNQIFRLKNEKFDTIYTFLDSTFIVPYEQNHPLILRKGKKNDFYLYDIKADSLSLLAYYKDRKCIGKNLMNREVVVSFLNDKQIIQRFTRDTILDCSGTDIQKNCYLNDCDNHLWLGTEEGLLQYFASGFTTYKRDVFPAAWCVIEDTIGNLWIGSYHYDFWKLTDTTIVTFPELARKGWNKGFHFHPSIDKRGTLYFPRGSSILTYDGKTFEQITHHDACLTSFYDKETDLLWVGTRKQVLAYNYKKDMVKRITESDGLSVRSYIVAINRDVSGNLWFGSFSGLTRYNDKTGELVNYNTKNNRLPSKGVMSIFNDYKGTTWFAGTQGLLWYDTLQDSLRKMEREEISDAVSFVTSIDSTWLVFNQPNGIYLMDLQAYYTSGSVSLFLFNERNGYMGVEPGQDGAFIDSKGNLWITSSTELVKLEPGKLQLRNHSATVRFSGINGEKLPYNTTKYTLSDNNNNAIINFEAVCFNRPYPVQYSWKLGDGAWSPWQSESYAVITDLNDGTSNLTVRTRIPGLPILATPFANISIQIQLSLWNQAWFFPTLLGIFVIAALIFLILLTMVQTRMLKTTREAKAAQVQTIISQMNPHFIFNVLASIQTMILTVSKEKANEYLVKMANLIRGFLDASTFNYGNSVTSDKTTRHLLSKELEILNSYIAFQQLIYPNRFDYRLTIEPTIQPESQTIPPMLLQPFAENAIRHGLLLKDGSGTLYIAITKPATNSIHIEISDNGIGIERSKSMQKESPFRYQSRGRELTMNRIRLMNELGENISMQIKSTENGTTVIINIENHE